MSTAAPKDPAPDAAYTLFDAEEQVLREAEDMVRKLDEVAGGVKRLAEAYGRGYREQSRLVRISDRMQQELQDANRNLTEQARELRALNTTLEAEIQERERLANELEKLATIDELTGLFGRRHFLSLANREFARQRRVETPVSVMMLDLDHFKRVNDTHGHAVGDSVLRTLADVLRAGLREMDVAGRLGGEEFSVLLTGAESTVAIEVAHRLRIAMAEQVVTTQSGDRVSCTISIGVAERDGDEALDDILNRADAALYAAKRAGRDRVGLAGAEARPESATIV
jgi:diguanylate cyclase (GGDEF)-like protein